MTIKEYRKKYGERMELERKARDLCSDSLIIPILLSEDDKNGCVSPLGCLRIEHQPRNTMSFNGGNSLYVEIIERGSGRGIRIPLSLVGQLARELLRLIGDTQCPCEEKEILREKLDSAYNEAAALRDEISEINSGQE